MGLNHLQSLICTYSADDLRLLMIASVTHILVISISYVTSSFVRSGFVLDVLCS